MKKALVLLAMFLPFAVSAEQISVEYSSFYSHIRKLDNEDLKALQFSFGFKRVGSNELCGIENAHIHTQKQTIPVVINNENRFTLPSEKALKMAKAEVVVMLKEAANRCDMSVQLETKGKYLKKSYTSEELQYLFQQYQNFFDEMGGFLSFMMPTATGITFLFDEPVTQVPEGLKVENASVSMDASWLAAGHSANWKVKPIRIISMTSG